jgi:cephalosporin-C deacetylase
VGSAASVQQFAKRCPKLQEVQPYYDAAIAARHIRVPVHCACALFDPTVAPAGQFAIYNAIQAPKSLFVLTAGHHSYPGMESEQAELQQECHNFFRDL